MYLKKYRIHFVGVAGIGMSGIAELLLNLGYRVSGSDLAETGITRRLSGLGGEMRKGHAPEFVGDADVVVVSSAVPQDNPEVEAARAAGIPVIPRAEMLAELMRLKFSVAVAGAHGKTTTTSIVSAVLAQGGLDPTIVVGGKLKSTGVNAKLGDGDFIVAEADESDGSFLRMSPSIAVVTNIDLEHVDYYKNMDAIMAAFANFVDRVPFYGLSILCLDCPAVQDLIPSINKRFVTYGQSPQADIRAVDRKPGVMGSAFTVKTGEKVLGEVKMSLPGEHNVENALAAITVGLELDIPFALIKESLESLEGVQRRLEIKGKKQGRTLIDDYGHHPTEIQKTLKAVQETWPGKRILAVFQPHRYTRTQALFQDFVRSFFQVDHLVLLPIYAASEAPIAGVTSAALAEAITSHGHKGVACAETHEQAARVLEAESREGDIILTLGAGDVWKVGEKIF